MGLNIEQKWLTPNKYSRPQTKLNKVRGIVVHWWALPNGSVNGVWNYYENRQYGKSNYGSAHFIVGLDGEILQCLPEDEMAYHVGAKKYYTDRLGSYPNSTTLGIEMAHTDWQGHMTKETWDTSVKLTAELLKKYDLGIDDIYTHHDITRKDCPKLFVNEPSEFNRFKQDVKKELIKEKVAIAMSKYFTDVPEHHWAKETLDKAKERGLVAGRTDGTFGLGENIKREEVVVLIDRAINYVMKELGK